MLGPQVSGSCFYAHRDRYFRGDRGGRIARRSRCGGWKRRRREYAQIAHRQAKRKNRGSHGGNGNGSLSPPREITSPGPPFQAGYGDVEAVEQKARDHQDGRCEQAFGVLTNSPDAEQNQRKNNPHDNFYEEESGFSCGLAQVCEGATLPEVLKTDGRIE